MSEEEIRGNTPRHATPRRTPFCRFSLCAVADIYFAARLLFFLMRAGGKRRSQTPGHAAAAFSFSSLFRHADSGREAKQRGSSRERRQLFLSSCAAARKSAPRSRFTHATLRCRRDGYADITAYILSHAYHIHAWLLHT